MVAAAQKQNRPRRSQGRMSALCYREVAGASESEKRESWTASLRITNKEPSERVSR